MKTLLTTLNAKYIHKSLSLRLLYVASIHRHNVTIEEYTIKDDVQVLASKIIDKGYHCVAFSVYIWNVEPIKQLCSLLKQKDPSIKILLGGPEVSYDIDHFLDTYDIDYIISGEGEIAFDLVLEAIKTNTTITYPGVSTPTKRDYHQTPAVDLQYIESLPSPYLLEQDKEDMKNRILYFETSRGCPYRCQYCLSSLEKGLRFFSIEYIIKQFEQLFTSGVKTIKFLDRSFNAKKEHAISILQWIIENNPTNISCQFEINGDVLDQEILDFVHHNAPKGMFRFEIGIQSTYEPTNKIVQRIQNFPRLKEVVLQLQEHQIVDLHLDLIAGLPLETLSRFGQSFDDVFAFRPKELQLGFLKLLRGTSLRKEASKYGYTYQQVAPYEITSGVDLSSSDIEKIHIAEDMLEKYWNSGKCPITMNYIMDQMVSPFDFFLEFGTYYKNKNYKTIHYQTDELFIYLLEYCQSINLDVQELLIEDTLRLSKVKPKRWWKSTIDVTTSKEYLHQLVEQYHLDQELVFRYGMIEKMSTFILLAIYKDFKVEIHKYPLI